MAQLFGAAVYSEMLCAGGGAHRFPLALYTPYKGFSVFGGKEGVFAVGFVASAPARVTENIDVGRPEGKSLVNIPVAVGGKGVIFCSCFNGGYFCRFFCKGSIKHSRKSDCLREHCGCACTGYSVKSLVPPVVGGDSEALNGGCVIAQLSCLFFGCKKVG